MTNVHNVGFLGIINRNRHFDGGRGTAANPYRIVKIRHFNNMRRYPTNTHYRLENDIVFTDEFEEDGEYYNDGSWWIAIPSFSGSIDGQGYKVENLKSYYTSSNRGSLVNSLGSNTTIKNIYFKNIHVDRSANFELHGGLFYQGTSTSIIEEIFVDGYIRMGFRVGGIIGRGGVTRRCGVNATIIGQNVVGGIVGGHNTIQTVRDCYAVGTIQNVQFHRAGIHGSTFGARIFNSFAAIPLLGSNNHLRRGIISAIDGYDGRSFDCFYDITVMGDIPSNNYDTGFTTGLTSTFMKYPYPEYNEAGDQAYDTWDFDTIWAHDVDGDINNGYPYLRNVTPIPDP